MTVVDMEGKLTGKEEHIGGFDLVYSVSDNNNQSFVLKRVFSGSYNQTTAVV